MLIDWLCFSATLIVLVSLTSCEEQVSSLQSCLDAFVVHRDKIIRTKDSEDMGAKYLTEFDVDTRFDCMRLCCETNHCDVFIFEEKKPGSCYLFHCGPPQDFKCKFTSHANYSSAVYTNYNLQNGEVLEEQIRHTQQEHELKSLRKFEPKDYGNYFTAQHVTTSSTPMPTQSTSTTAASVKRSKCSRNQFECRSNDDCIAIYNVCDGIPQCPDGSDEAAELGCPNNERTTMPPAPLGYKVQQQVPVTSKSYQPVLSPDAVRYQQMMQRGQYPMVYQGSYNVESAKSWEPPSANQPNYKQNAYQWGGYPAAVPYYDQSVVQKTINEEQRPRIFNHKGSEMRIEEIEPPNGLYNQDSHRVYAPYYPAVMNRPDKWHEDKQVPIAAVVPTPKVEVTHENHPIEEVRKHDEHEGYRTTTTIVTPEPCNPQDSKENKASKTQEEIQKKPIVENSQKDIPSEASSKRKDTDKNPSENQELKESSEKAVKMDIHKIHEAELHTMAGARQQERKSLAMAEHIRHHGAKLEELEMSRPKGAVISLALGLTVTAIMAVLIACRLRVVKRRGRGRDFAHDADYLVNGMYL